MDEGRDRYDNGRITRKEFYECMGGLEGKLIARIDRLEDKVSDEHDKDIDRLEKRINADRKIVGIGSLIGSIIGTTVGFIGWTK